MKRGIPFLLLGLVGGFFIHALVFPDLFSNGIFIVPPPISPTHSPVNITDNAVPIETVITYDGKKFSRTNIRIELSRYVSLININKSEMMSLSSDYAELSTPRPYAYDEQIKARMDKKGTFTVTDRSNPSIRLVITVN